MLFFNSFHVSFTYFHMCMKKLLLFNTVELTQMKLRESQVYLVFSDHVWYVTFMVFLGRKKKLQEFKAFFF